MHKQDKQIQEFFEQGRTALDDQELLMGHEDRFLQRLGAKQEKKKRTWFSYSAIAAAVVLIFSVILFNQAPEVVDNPPAETNQYTEEVAKAQFYFEGIIERGLDRIKGQEDEDTKPLINNLKQRFEQLKKEEEALLEELSVNYDRRIVKALVDNFQLRINLLNEVEEQMQSIHQLKNEYHENTL